MLVETQRYQDLYILGKGGVGACSGNENSAAVLEKQLEALQMVQHTHHSPNISTPK